MAESLNKEQFDIDKVDRNKIYYVEWHDAFSSAGWHSPEQLEDFINLGKCICHEVGWILYETKDEITMAARRTSIAESYEWGLLQKIPKAWIKKKICFNLNSCKKGKK